jgi:hypothetical protein
MEVENSIDNIFLESVQNKKNTRIIQEGHIYR